MIAHEPTELWKSGFVRRWHANPKLAGTNDRLDGHQARVAWIIIESMAPRMPSAELLFEAITHDAGELYSGDLPTDFKAANPELADVHRRKEKHARYNIVGRLCNLSEFERKMLLFADRFDAYLWAQWHGENMNSPEWKGVEKQLYQLGAELVNLEAESNG